MKQKGKEIQERVFTIELESKGHLRNVSLTNGSGDRVLVEGTIGELVQASFSEGVILEVIGKKGVLRIDLDEKELKRHEKDSLPEVMGQ